MKISPKAERILEDGWYPFEIRGVEDKDTKFGEKLMLPFFLETDGVEVEVTAFLSYSDHPKSNVVKFGTALFGDRSFDTDEFEGARGEAFVVEGEDSEGQPKNFIRKVRPRKGQKVKPAPESEPEAPDFDKIPL